MRPPGRRTVRRRKPSGRRGTRRGRASGRDGLGDPCRGTRSVTVALLEEAGGDVTVHDMPVEIGRGRIDRAAGRLRERTAGVEAAAGRRVRRAGHVAHEHDAAAAPRRIDVRHGGKQGVRVGVEGRPGELVRRAVLDHAAQVHHRHLVGDVLLGTLIPGIGLTTSRACGQPSITTNVEYASVGGRSLRLDVHRAAGNEPCPAVVLVHGGGFTGGAKGGYTGQLARHLAAHGFVAFDIDYRLRGDLGPDAYSKLVVIDG